MSAGQPLPSELTPQEMAAVLGRIVEAVEQDKRSRRVEITCAFVLSLATTASAWCAYQSTLWGGVQTFRLAAANKANRASVEETLAALQYKSFDASMFINWMHAKHEGNERHEKFLFHRFRPEAKKAVEAWLKNDPFNDPAARFKSDCSTARKNLGPIPVERRIETYPGGIVAACMRAEHSRAAQAARRMLYCDVKPVWAEACALQRIKNGELPIG